MSYGSYTELVLYGELPARQVPSGTVDDGSLAHHTPRAGVRHRAQVGLVAASLAAALLCRRGAAGHGRIDRVRSVPDHLAAERPAEVPAAAGLRAGLGGGDSAQRVPEE